MKRASAAVVLVAMASLLFCIHAGSGTSMAGEDSLRAAAHMPAGHGERCDLELQRDAARQAGLLFPAAPMTASIDPAPMGPRKSLSDVPSVMGSAAPDQPPPSLHHRSVLFRI